ncbi:SDR family oxidoreductase [Vitiosangium sp. GDMCC 1.1324]|uniref:SDR family oxidoreductase n=1 Tax=Vitiosangium sp. (strain GDMCC 1.1324) TaxID=2138576 RepID=UPI000D35B01A|nr:SDR family oxidoreductase [Vitiosangium sp. GDMCC 1.1324]PTL79825.1 epimerase [Vitiosangium sp. GDMCC 1.1324]
MKLSRRGVLKGAAALGSLWAVGCATTRESGEAPQVSAPRSGGSKRILILGGTGFLGPQLVDAARARGHTVTLFNRGKTRPQLFPDVEKLHGDRDPRNGEGLKALEGRSWDAVIDTSGYVPRIVRASAELLAPHVGHYVFISTISVYKELPRPGMDEDSPLATVSDPSNEDVRENYGALKALCEKAAEAAFPGRTTNIRPGLIVGPDDPTQRFTYWPVRVARGGEVLAPGSGEDPAQFIDVRDLAEWTLLAIENRDLGTFNATGPAKPLTMKELLEACRQASSGDAAFTWADAAFLETQSVRAWMDMPVWVTPEGEMAGMSAVSNARAVARGLKFRPTVDTARDTLAWFNGLPPERQAELQKRAGLSPEREREVLAAWRQQRAGSAHAR